MKVNSDKGHLYLSCNEPFTLVIGGSPIEINTKEVLLRITIDKDLKFDDDVNSLCKNITLLQYMIETLKLSPEKHSKFYTGFPYFL